MPACGQSCTTSRDAHEQAQDVETLANEWPDFKAHNDEVKPRQHGA